MIFLSSIRTLLYLTCAVANALIGSTRRGRDALPWFWYGLAIVIAVLGGILAFRGDLWMSGVLRRQAQLSGWYDRRVPVQVLALSIVTLAEVAFLAQLFRHPSWGRRPRLFPTLAVGLLVLLATVRIVSLHFTDHLLGARLIGAFSVGMLFEGAVLLALLLHAVYVLRMIHSRSD